ncbi:S-adenosyl-L-methionine-dependent methyltransferase [Aspergillus karnatakaensis]|uniref:S-adenosyl-L-methionine-dependent methyltransferase n=1 Tax=Aspergillus karnatakaensis TaxID=1810916 RepID=UPI003CCCCF5B
MAMSYYIKVNLRAISQGKILAPILEAHRLRDEAFGEFWVAFSSNREEPPQEPDSATPAPTNPPLEDPPQLPEEQNITASSDLIPPILAQATGIVLDVGPGTGTQMPLLTSPSIKAIYGAEPCIGLHPELRKRAEKEGVSDKYTILPCSVDAVELGRELEKHNLSPSGREGEGLFDTIITIRVLCSVPNLPSTTTDLYKLLKPGGKLLVVEHTVNPWKTSRGSIVARGLQIIYHALGWRWVMGDCSMDRPTEELIRSAPGRVEKGVEWESVQVTRCFEGTCMPYLAGVFVKRG